MTEALPPQPQFDALEAARQAAAVSDEQLRFNELIGAPGSSEPLSPAESRQAAHDVAKYLEQRPGAEADHGVAAAEDLPTGNLRQLSSGQAMLEQAQDSFPDLAHANRTHDRDEDGTLHALRYEDMTSAELIKRWAESEVNKDRTTADNIQDVLQDRLIEHGANAGMIDMLYSQKEKTKAAMLAARGEAEGEDEPDEPSEPDAPEAPTPDTTDKDGGHAAGTDDHAGEGEGHGGDAGEGAGDGKDGADEDGLDVPDFMRGDLGPVPAPDAGRGYEWPSGDWDAPAPRHEPWVSVPPVPLPLTPPPAPEHGAGPTGSHASRAVGRVSLRPAAPPHPGETGVPAMPPVEVLPPKPGRRAGWLPTWYSGNTNSGNSWEAEFKGPEGRPALRNSPRALARAGRWVVGKVVGPAQRRRQTNAAERAEVESNAGRRTRPSADVRRPVGPARDVNVDELLNPDDF